METTELFFHTFYHETGVEVPHVLSSQDCYPTSQCAVTVLLQEAFCLHKSTVRSEYKSVFNYTHPSSGEVLPRTLSPGFPLLYSWHSEMPAISLSARCSPLCLEFSCSSTCPSPDKHKAGNSDHSSLPRLLIGARKNVRVGGWLSVVVWVLFIRKPRGKVSAPFNTESQCL